MNMRVAMTDEQLLAQRAARTGRALPMNKTGDVPAGPAQPLAQRNPLDGFDVDGNPPFDPTQLPPGDPGAGNSAPPLPQGNQTPAEIAALQQQLDAANGRLGPVQRQIEEMRATMATMQQQLAAKDAELATRHAAETAARATKEAEAFDPFADMSADQIALIDPAVLDAMRTSARKALAQANANAGKQDSAKMIADALAARDKLARDRYVRATAESLNLVALGNDPKFQQFLRDDDSAGLLLNSFVQAPDVDEARNLEKRVRTMLKRYEAATATPNQPPADPNARLAAHLSRQGSGSGAPGSQRKALTAEEAKAVRVKAASLTRNRKFKEANELLAQLN